MARQAVVIDEKDNVATATADLARGKMVHLRVDGMEMPLAMQDDIPFGHKFATHDIAAGEQVIKYGESIGRATQPIAAGAHVHVHNVESERGRGDLETGR